MSNLVEKTIKPVSSEKNIADKLAEERISWTEIIKDLSSRFRSVENLAEVQIDLYSNRQIALEYQYKLISIHSKSKKNLITEWKMAYERIEKNEDLRLSEKEKTRNADAQTVDLKYKNEVISNQIEFFRETIKTLDSMIFGVKHRIDIENFKVGNK